MLEAKSRRAYGSRPARCFASEGFAAEQIELRRSLRMRYAAQVHDIEVPLEAGAPLDSDAVTAAFASLYEALHGEGSGHPEGGIAITTLVIRARGLTEPLALVTPPPEAEQAPMEQPARFTGMSRAALPTRRCCAFRRAASSRSSRARF